MKARPFLALLLALALTAVGLGAGGWWLVWQRGPLALQHRSGTLPLAARFVPRQAPLSLYLLSDGEEPVAYARAVAPSRDRRQAAAALQRLRDGAFAAAGLDYGNELASWLAPEISLALFDLPGNDSPSGSATAPGANWLLALRSRDGDGARRFLQRFWQTRSLAGADLQVSRYRGMGLISGRGALAGRSPVPLATALISDDLLLIASGRGVLEQALDVSQIDELNQAADPGLRQGLQSLGDGAALVVARSPGLAAGLGLPPQPGSGTLLLASLRPEGSALRLEGVLQRPDLDNEPSASPPLAAAERRSLLTAAPPASDSLALLSNPAQLLRDPLLGPLLAGLARGGSAGPLPPLLLQAAQGPLLLAEAVPGWLMATPPQSPSPEVLEAPLAAAGLIPAPLEVQGRQVTVWTRLVADRRARGDAEGLDRLQAPLEGWRGELDGLALWGRSLGLLEASGAGKGAPRRERQLEALNQPDAPLQWALAAEPARSLLHDWLPWRRLNALAGGPLDGAVRGVALALQPGGDGLRLRGWLDFGPGA